MQNIWIFYQDGGTPQQGWGDRHYFLAKEYIKKGYTVTLFAGNNCHRYSHPVEFKGNYLFQEIEKNFQYCWIKVPAYSESISIRRILSWFLFAAKIFLVPKKRIGKPDVIVVSSIPMFPILTGIAYKLKYKAKLIFEIRDIWPLTVIQVGNYSKYHPFVLLLRCIEIFGYRMSDHIVSVLQYADLHIRESIKAPFNFTWISNGFSPKYLDSKALTKSHEALNLLPENKFIVGYTGTFGTSNANEFLIQAANVLKNYENIHFVLVGEGPEKNKLIKESDGLNNVTFIPKVPKNVVQSILNKFNAAYVGSRHLDIYKYGISANKMFDYMNAGLPIILSSQYKNNIIETAKCGFTVKPESGEEIAKAVLALYNLSPSEQRSIGMRGMQFAQENFHYDNLADKFVKLFESKNGSKI